MQKNKQNGVFCRKIVTCGYSQIPGVDYEQNYLPDINNIIFRVLILAMVIYKLSAKIVAVETKLNHHY